MRVIIIDTRVYMLKASLKNHDPIVLYDFLQRNIGPLKMNIRNGYAFIRFNSQSHFRSASQRFSSFNLTNNKIELQPYNQENEQSNVMVPQEEKKDNEDEARKETPSKEILSIHQGLEIKDQFDVIEKVVKAHRKKMIQYIATYDSFMTEAQQKIKRYSEQVNASDDGKNKIRQFLDKQLKNVYRNLKNNFITLSASLKQFDQQKQKQINLDPELECKGIQQKPLHFNSLKEHIQYLNKEKNSVIRRLCSLNSTQFISSVSHEVNYEGKVRHEGNIKIYNVNKEIQTTSITSKEGSYGLLVLDNYIINGTYQGNFSFYHHERINAQELSPRIFGNYQERYTIKDILRCGQRRNGSNIIALAINGGSNIVKSVFAEEVQMYPNISSLIFEQSHQIALQKQAINSIDVLQQRQMLLLGCCTNLKSYDLNKCAFIGEMNVLSQIFKIKKINNNMTYLAQRKNIGLVDLRTSQIIKYSFKSDITSICVLNQNSVIYGSERGEIGLFDNRKQKQVSSNTLCHKSFRVNDIIKHNDFIISGDSEGQIVSWKGS